MKLGDLVNEGAKVLEAAGIDSAQNDAELLAAFALEISKGQLQSDVIVGKEISQSDADEISELFKKRAERIPLQHLTGLSYFRNLELEVGKGVFIPRPETEVVTGLAIDAAKAVPGTPIVVDLCTGSGSISLSIATEVPNSEVHAWELNPESENYLRKNIAKYGNRVQLTMADVSIDSEEFEKLYGRVDVVVSNPPYIPTDMIPQDIEVRLHEPELALYSGPDGMDLMRHISRRAQQLLRPGGFFVVEHADSQAAIVADLFRQDGWRQIRGHRDFNGRDRATTAIK